MRLHLRSLMGLTVLLVLTGAMAIAQNDNVFTCSSDDGQLHSCRVDTDRPIQFVRQRSSAQCVEGQSYGIDRGGVWVTNGCRADFAVVNSDRAYNDGYYNQQGAYNNGYDDRDNNRDGYRDQNGNWHSRRHRHGNHGSYNNNGSYSGSYQGPYNNGGYVGAGPQHPTTYYGKYDNGKATCSATRGTGPVYCQTDGALSDATIINQNGRCQRGQTWDINPDGLWVADGCSAQFRVQR